MKIGYARCSTDKQDLTAQTQALLELGVKADRIYTDHGFTGRNKARPGLNQALKRRLGQRTTWEGSPPSAPVTPSSSPNETAWPAPSTPSLNQTYSSKTDQSPRPHLIR